MLSLGLALLYCKEQFQRNNLDKEITENWCWLKYFSPSACATSWMNLSQFFCVSWRCSRCITFTLHGILKFKEELNKHELLQKYLY